VMDRAYTGGKLVVGWEVVFVVNEQLEVVW